MNTGKMIPYVVALLVIPLLFFIAIATLLNKVGSSTKKVGPPYTIKVNK